MSLQIAGGGVANIRQTTLFLGRSTQNGSTSLSASGGSELIAFTPSIGELWEILWLYFYVAAPAGASAATHQCQILVWDTAGSVANQDVTIGISNYNAMLKLDKNTWTSATNSKIPLDEAAQVLQILNAKIDKDHPLHFAYINYTDAAQTNTRSYKVGYRKVLT